MPEERNPNFYHLMLGLPEDVARPNHYQLLGLDPKSANERSIRDASADQNGKLLTWQNSKYYKEAGQLMLELVEARSVLLDPPQRATYDRKLKNLINEDEPIVLLTSEKDAEPILLSAAVEKRAPKVAIGRSGRKVSPGKARRIVVLIGLLILVGSELWNWPASEPKNRKQPYEDLAESKTEEPAALDSNLSPPVTAIATREDAFENKVGMRVENAKPDQALSEAAADQSNQPEDKPSIPQNVELATAALNLPIAAITQKLPPWDRESPPLAVSPFDADAAKRFQDAWARNRHVPVDVTNRIGLKLRLIPPGEFQMGSPIDEVGRSGYETQHLVRLTKPYFMSCKEITVREFVSVLNYKPPATANAISNEQDDMPIIRVTWHDCIHFCNQLSHKEGLPPYYTLHDVVRSGKQIARATVTLNGGDGYRLPTDAEWEFACRAGTTTAYAFGETLSPSQANIRDPDSPESWSIELGGTYPPNAFGLYDMHGNLSEWCFDYHDPKLYESTPQIDPVGLMTIPTFENKRVIRSGGPNRYSSDCRSANHFWYFENHRGTKGFRVVRFVGSNFP